MTLRQLKEFKYRYIEQSVDERVWDIKSSAQLSEHEIIDLVSCSYDSTYEKVKHKTPIYNANVTYVGIKFGDDTQIEIIGDTMKEDDDESIY